MENTEKSYTRRNIYIISDSHAGIKALHSYQINSELVWDCLVEMVEYNRVQLVWVLGYMGIDGS